MRAATARSVFGVAALLALACTGEPDDPFFFFGKVVHGAPASPGIAGQALRLERGYGDSGCPWSFHETVGFPPLELEPFQETTSEADGAFLFEVKRYQLRPIGSYAASYCFQISGETAEGGSTEVRLNVFESDTEVDQLLVWPAVEFSFDTTAGELLITPPPQPVPPIEPAQATWNELLAYEWVLHSGGKPFWRGERTGDPLTVEAWMREDFAAPEVRVDLLATLMGPVGMFGPLGAYSLIARSGSQAVPPATAQVPPSRGAPCTFGGTAYDPCPLTDGALDLVFLEPASSGGEPTSLAVEFTLDAAMTPAVMVLRDVQAVMGLSINVTGSVDGTTWHLLGTFNLGGRPDQAPGAYQMLAGGSFYGAIPLTAPPEPVHLIRIETQAAIGAREISFLE